MQITNLKQHPEVMQQLAQWHHTEWQDYNYNLTFDERLQRLHLHLNDESVPSTYIAVDGGLLGSAAIVHHDMTNHQELSPWLASVYVEMSRRRQGIGSQLVRHVMQQALHAGFSELYLFTPDQVAFYQRLGWQSIINEHYSGHDVTIMRIGLANN